MNAHFYFSRILPIVITIMAVIVLGLSFTVRSETPDSLTHNIGTVDSGNLASFRAVDNDFYNISETVGTPALDYELTLENTDMNAGTEWMFIIRCFYDGSAGHNLDLQIYDNNLLSWVDIIDIPDGLTISNLYSNQTLTDNWINGDGDVELRMYHSSPGNINHVYGVDYIEIVEQKYTGNATFYQQVSMRFDEFWSNGYDYFSNSLHFQVLGDVIINSSGLLQMNDSSLCQFDSLTVLSGGEYSETSLITWIDNKNAGGRSLDIQNGGLFTKNGGCVRFTLSSTIIIINQGVGNFNDLLCDSTGLNWQNSLNIDGDLTVSAVKLMKPLSVSGNDIVVLGTIYNSGDFRTNSNNANFNNFYNQIGAEFRPLDSIVTIRLFINNGTFTESISEMNFIDTGITNEVVFNDLSVNGTVKFLENFTCDVLNIGDNSFMNCTKGIIVDENVLMSNTGNLILSGNGSTTSGIFYYFYPGNNTYSNIIQYNGTYNISKITNSDILFNCDNFTQYGSVDVGTLETFSKLNIFNWNSNNFNYQSNAVDNSNVFGYSEQYNLAVNNFNQTVFGISENQQPALTFNSDVLLGNGTFSGIRSIDFTQNLFIDGLIITVDHENFIFQNSDRNLTISNTGHWELNNRLSTLQCLNLVVNGELRFVNNTLQTKLYSSSIFSLDITIDYSGILFDNSTGELNLSASVLNPLTIIGNLDITPETQTNVSMSNMSDYYLNNIIVWYMNNTRNDYITINGIPMDGVTGNWDFLPPTITPLELINNTVYARNGTNIVNISVYFEELSYFHSYYLQLIEPTGSIIYQLSVNLSTPLNNTFIYQNINLTNFINGLYTYNILVNDTHNKVNELDLYKIEKAKNLKIQIDDIENKVGYWDKHKIKENGKFLYFIDYMENDIKYWVEFEEKGDHEIIYNTEDYNFKILHNMKVKQGTIKFKICSNYQINYFPGSYYAGHFIINDIYAYELQDFINMNGSLSVSHLMKEGNYSYYEVTLSHPNMEENKFFEIDPLSMLVNSNITVFYFNFGGSGSAFGNLTIVDSPEYENTNSNYTVVISDFSNAIVKYVFISSIDGVFYNNTSNETDLNNLSAGEHTINVYVINNINNYILIDSVQHWVFKTPIAKIVFVYVNGNSVQMSGSYQQIQNNTIYRFAWRTNVTGEFFNGTDNPITLIELLNGDYALFLKIMDENGIWSNEVTVNFTVSNTTVLTGDEYWWVNANSFIYVIGAIGILIGIVYGLSLISVEVGKGVIDTFGNLVKALRFKR